MRRFRLRDGSGNFMSSAKFVLRWKITVLIYRRVLLGAGQLSGARFTSVPAHARRLSVHV
jgi:hypothetical protein